MEQSVKARHEALGYEVELVVPLESRDRPAVAAFMSGQYYEPETHSAFAAILRRRRGAAVHAGTFFGDMLDTLSRNATAVVAFEPVARNFELATINSASLSNVTLYHAALSNRDGHVRMATRTWTRKPLGGASTVSPRGNEVTRCMKLDTLGLRDVSLIHLDVEGHELSALEGAKGTIVRDRPTILIEDNAKNCDAFLATLGYSRAGNVETLGLYGAINSGG